MDRRKIRKKKKMGLKKKKMGYQEFMDKITLIHKERHEMENFLRRVWVFNAEDVLEYMEIKKKNEEILEEHIRQKALRKSLENSDSSELNTNLNAGLNAESELMHGLHIDKKTE
ncbi:MAG: hypothetical protein ACP5NA_01980 [Candidatus Acidulodesulfobacterium sp.]